MSNVAETNVAAGPVGIGGWLILPIIGFAGTALLTGVNMVLVLGGLDDLKMILAADSGPLATIKVPMVLSAIAGILVIVSASCCLYLIFAKRHGIVKFATAHYVILASSGLADYWAGATLENALPNVPSDPNLVREALRGIFIACIWIPYFQVSKRVKNTFINVNASGSQGPTNSGTVETPR